MEMPQPSAHGVHLQQRTEKEVEVLHHMLQCIYDVDVCLYNEIV